MAMMARSGRSTPGMSWRAWASLSLFAAAYAVLIPGLVAPLFSVHATVDVFGVKTPLFDIKKSAVGSVQLLFKNGHYLAASLILLFSTIVPFLKLAAILYAAQCLMLGYKPERTVNTVRAISKWATVDAFCVIIFAAMLSGHANIHMDIHAGFYCFASFCLLSVAAALVFPYPWPEDEAPYRSSLHHGSLSTIINILGPGAILLGCCLGLFSPVIALRSPVFQVDQAWSIVDLAFTLKTSGRALLAAAALVLVAVIPILEAFRGLAGTVQAILPKHSIALQHWAMLDVFAVSLFVTAQAAQGVSDQMIVEVLPVGWIIVFLAATSLIAKCVPKNLASHARKADEFP